MSESSFCRKGIYQNKFFGSASQKESTCQRDPGRKESSYRRQPGPKKKVLKRPLRQSGMGQSPIVSKRKARLKKKGSRKKGPVQLSISPKLRVKFIRTMVGNQSILLKGTVDQVLKYPIGLTQKIFEGEWECALNNISFLYADKKTHPTAIPREVLTVSVNLAILILALLITPFRSLQI